MAKIDDLNDQVRDADLRSQLGDAVAELREVKKFGLVFEEHIPESVTVPELPVSEGNLVQLANDVTKGEQFRVVEVTGDEAKIERADGKGRARMRSIAELVRVVPFGQAIFPGLVPDGELRSGAEDRPTHAVFNAENFHALQMLSGDARCGMYLALRALCVVDRSHRTFAP